MNGAAMRVLVVEDDPDGRRSIIDALEDCGLQVDAAASGLEGVRSFDPAQHFAVLSDLVLPDIDGVEVLERILRIQADTPVVIMTAHGTVETAVRAMKEGAYDYVLKPLDLDLIQTRMRHAAEAGRLRSEVRALRAGAAGSRSARNMIADSPPMRALMDEILKVAATDATVFVHGESGSGKELVAQALHADGRRADGPFVAVNCGALSESLLEAELFGHEKGAFTGASARRRGAFERADGGTLFLDEIGAAPAAVQTRLLRVLEDRTVLRVGGETPLRVDVRVVSATHEDIAGLVADGRFREDLRYRLQVVSLHVPPLRERTGDIRALADRFVAQACEAHGRHFVQIDAGFYSALAQRPWPGNVRELRNAVESAVVLARRDVLSGEDVGQAIGGAAAPAQAPAQTLAELERIAIEAALTRHSGNRTLAAAELDVSVRTIQRKIKDFDLPF